MSGAGPPQPPAAPAHPTGLVEAVTVRLGLALHRFGTPSHQLEHDLGRLARRFAVPGQFMATPTLLIASFGCSGPPRVYVERGEQASINVDKLSELHATTEAIVAGELSLADGLIAIDRVLQAPSAWPAAAAAAAYGVTSAAVARLLDGGRLEMALAGMMGLTIGTLAQLARGRRTLEHLLDIAAAVACALLAALAARLVTSVSMSIATLAGLVVLLPGMALTIAMTELATGNLVSGVARLSGVGITFLKLGFGVALGSKIGVLLFAPPQLVAGAHAVGWTHWPAVALAAAALGVVLQAHRRDMPAIVGVCLMGNAGLVLGGRLLGGEMAAFVAALLVSLASSARARWRGGTEAVTQTPAILLLVPGGVGYRSIAALMQRDVVTGMQVAFSAALTAVALAAGVLLANMLFPPRRVSY